MGRGDDMTALVLHPFDRHAVVDLHRDVTVPHREVAGLQRAGQGFTRYIALGWTDPSGL